MSDEQPPMVEVRITPTVPKWLGPALMAIFAFALNIGAYMVIPDALISRLGEFGYVGAFLTALIGNATVVVPIPYMGVIARLGQILDPFSVAVVAAVGSAVGESVSFFIGRAGHRLAEGTSLYTWIHAQLQHPMRAFVVLMLLSAPPNPTFDVAGILAGALDIPFWLFFSAVCLGRIARMSLITFGAQWILG